MIIENIISKRLSVVFTLVRNEKFKLMNATWKYLIKKFQKIILTIF